MAHQHTRTELISDFGDLTVGLYERVQALTTRGVDPRLIAKFKAWGEKVLSDLAKLQRTYFYVLDKADAVAQSHPTSSPPRRRPSNVVSLRPRRKR